MILAIESQLRACIKQSSDLGPPRMRWRMKEPNGRSSPRSAELARASWRQKTLPSSPYKATISYKNGNPKEYHFFETRDIDKRVASDRDKASQWDSTRGRVV